MMKFRPGTLVHRRSYKPHVCGKVYRIQQFYGPRGREDWLAWVDWDDGSASRVNVRALIRVAGPSSAGKKKTGHPEATRRPAVEAAGGIGDSIAPVATADPGAAGGEGEGS